MNIDTELHFTLAAFISLMFESICYGEHRPTTAFDSDTNLYSPSYRYLLRDIRCIRNNSIQDKYY
jgi:hypothetical protein